MLASVAAGVVRMGWSFVEVLFLEQPSWTWIEVYYFALGLAMAVLGLMLWRG